nr:PREDICTED: dachshund homolog 2 [Latimeria chalumnae]|eukprot:XP_014346749.1 PREDICTED: dachshund homolog 2 [Latimeria chalumnae]
MAVSAPPPAAVLSGASTPAAGALFRSEPLYSSPAESPRLPTSTIASFIHSGGGGGGGTSECKMVDLHGVKVASFLVDGQELICLPQVFDLFLKHLVGGLHTVYTKLKRLDISPVVCTVEQVRILRGLGAIQPGVNRCKLITRKDFETLYNDCTNASSRPGRPPKRSLGVTMQDNARLLPHGVPGLLSPGLISPTGLTAAAMAEAMKLQKMKLMAINNLHGSASQNGTESENEELNSNTGGSESSWDKEKLQSPGTTGSQHGVGHPTLSGQHNLGTAAHPLSSLQQNHLLTNRLDLPFMMMPHPLLPVSLPPASVAMAMNQMNHLNTIANMAAAVQMHSPLSRAGGSVIKERIQDSPSPAPSLDDTQGPGSHVSSHQSSSVSSSPSQHGNSADRIGRCLLSNVEKLDFSPRDKSCNWAPFWLKKKRRKASSSSQFCEPTIDITMLPNSREGELLDQDTGTSLKKMHKEKGKPSAQKKKKKKNGGNAKIHESKTPQNCIKHPSCSACYVQGLLKVAMDNARVQEKQIQQEKKELKMELFRERELRESLERQLTAELQSRATIQKRLKKEKKAKKKLQEALEFESKRREQVEQALKQATSADSLRMLNDAGIPEMEAEHNGTQHDDATIQENRPYMKPPILF